MHPGGIIYALKERIGAPELFTGRAQELAFLQNWVERIPRKLSQSTALLSRRKKGKTALVQRLCNLVYTQNGPVIPFYFEVEDKQTWVVEFAHDFYQSFIAQYLGFKLRRPELCYKPQSFEDLTQLAAEQGFQELLHHIHVFQYHQAEGHVDLLLDHVLAAPHDIAAASGEYIMQVIDEFQFLNSHLYWDQEKKNQARDVAGAYHSLAESKIAPVLATVSWVGWLGQILRDLLPARFRYMYLKNLTEAEGLEAIFKYSAYCEVPITEEVAIALNELVHSDPYYISAIINSAYAHKDLTTTAGLLDTIDFETRDPQGAIYGFWSEYIGKTLSTVNETYAKKIVLFLTAHREQEWTRSQIIQQCQLPFSEAEAEEKLRLLVAGDLIAEGRTSIDYRGLDDPIFYKVFRYRFEKEITGIPLEESVAAERRADEEKIARGRENQESGDFLEFRFRNYLLFKRKQKPLRELVDNWQEGAEFTDYKEVKRLQINLEGGRICEIDVAALGFDPTKNLYCEIKNWTKRVGKKEAIKFLKLKEIAHALRMQGYFLFYAAGGFTQGAREILTQEGIMYSDAQKWPLT